MRIKVEFKKDVKMVPTVTLEPLAYNTIRSFVSSSSKSAYAWNQGQDFGDHVDFTKEGKWTLRVWKETETTENPVIASLLDRKGREVLSLIITTEDVRISIGGHEFGIDGEVMITPLGDIPFAVPIHLSEVKERLAEYFIVPTIFP